MYQDGRTFDAAEGVEYDMTDADGAVFDFLLLKALECHVHA